MKINGNISEGEIIELFLHHNLTVKRLKKAIDAIQSKSPLKKQKVYGDIYSVKDANQFKQLITVYNELTEKFGVVNYFLDHNSNSVVFIMRGIMRGNKKITTTNLQTYINLLSEKRGFDIFDKEKNKNIKIELDKSNGSDKHYFKLKLKLPKT